MTEQAAQEQWRWEDREHGDTYCRGDGFEVYGGEAMAAYLSQQSTALAIATAKAELAAACVGLMYNPLLMESPEAKEWLRRAMEAGMDTEHPRSLRAALTAMSTSAGGKEEPNA